MTIRTKISGSPCIVTMADPGGQTRIRGRVWRWEYCHGMFALLRKDGEPMSLNACVSGGGVEAAIKALEKTKGSQ